MDPQEFDRLLSKYADVVVQVGLNLRNEQRLSVRAILDDAPFIRKVTESAYKAGARYVDVMWTDEPSYRTYMEYADDEALTEIPDWILTRYEEYYKRGDAELAIHSSNPDLLEGIDPDRIAKSSKARLEKLVGPLQKYENASNWCVAATATPSWARKVFPAMPVEEAQTKLWQEIFKACRIDVPDPVNAWKVHTWNLEKYRDYLNNKSYTALHYKAPGTDLTIGLPKNQAWCGAQESFKNGITCTVNIPTEEVFTAPHKDKADGVVTSSRPLNLLGTLIEDFSLSFENGRIVKITAKKGEADLRKLTEMDENASRLGEVALVPNSSPISQSGILFYNTLFDENAASHIALGNAYRTSIKSGIDMTDEEFAAEGGNKSLVHTDFMIGSAEMDIDGITEDGTREPVMRAGEWAFEV
ncbi:MAG TPA: aminopeptidase [Anaerolineae bacterium]|nr:aminopeptidase [Anaerolineae bacterium]